MRLLQMRQRICVGCGNQFECHTNKAQRCPSCRATRRKMLNNASHRTESSKKRRSLYMKKWRGQDRVRQYHSFYVAGRRYGFAIGDYVARRFELADGHEVCAECAGVAVTLDHIVPMRLFALVPEVFGDQPNLRSNLQALCKECNRIKTSSDARYLFDVRRQLA